MNSIIIYKSVFHSTEQYARWLAEELATKAVSMKKLPELTEYQRIIIMSGTYAGSMPLVKFVTKNWQKLADKEVILIAVGAAPPDDPMSVQSYQRIPAEIRDQVQYFKISGATPFAKAEKRAQEIVPENLNKVLDYLRR